VLGCAVVRRGAALLLARRPVPGLFGGLWAPPAAELEPGEGGRALVAAIGRAHAVSLAVGAELATCERTLTHRVLTLRAFRAEVRGRLDEGAGLRFVAPGEIEALGVPAAVRELLARL
jgi:A/G-specific adenine glycosylase